MGLVVILEPTPTLAKSGLRPRFFVGGGPEAIQVDPEFLRMVSPRGVLLGLGFGRTAFSLDRLPFRCGARRDVILYAHMLRLAPVCAFLTVCVRRVAAGLARRRWRTGLGAAGKVVGRRSSLSGVGGSEALVTWGA